MKLAIDCRMIGSGGIGSYISALLPFFIKEHQCLLFGTENQIAKYKSENTELFFYNEPCFSIKELFLFPKSLLKKINNCDAYYSPYCNIPSRFFSKISIPIFTTIHDVVFLDVEGLSSKLGTKIRKLFYKRACILSKTIFTVSNFSAKRIIFHLNPKNPVVCTYNALPDWFFEKNDKNQIQKKDVILFVGNIKKHKGLSTLVEAFISAKKQGLTTSLLIVGNKDNFRTKDNSIFDKIKDAPANSINFTGKITDEELKKVYKSAKVLVQPSLYEGFGMPPLEALNLGTNVILSDIPVFKEIYKNFPVTFFKTEDSSDLCKKLLSLNTFEPYPQNIPNIYSFERTYTIIKETMEK